VAPNGVSPSAPIVICAITGVFGAMSRAARIACSIS
jgi:hypothetical protein